MEIPNQAQTMPKPCPNQAPARPKPSMMGEFLIVYRNMMATGGFFIFGFRMHTLLSYIAGNIPRRLTCCMHLYMLILDENAGERRGTKADEDSSPESGRAPVIPSEEVASTILNEP